MPAFTVFKCLFCMLSSFMGSCSQEHERKNVDPLYLPPTQPRPFLQPALLCRFLPATKSGGQG